MKDGQAILCTEGAHYAYRVGAEVLHGVDMAAHLGELLCVLGPNGSGKTTLLRCLLGQLALSQGAITLAGRDLARYSAMELARLVSYVPQNAGSAFAFTVAQVVMMGRTPHMGRLGLPSDVDRRVVAAAMEMTGTTELAGRDLETLSGGERQTVMITRALAQQPQVMLLDEPTSHLDVKHQLDIYRLMAKLAHDWGMAVVCVSHDVNLAGRFADRLMLLREGRRAAAGTPGEVIGAEVLEAVYQVPMRLVDVGLPVPMAIAENPDRQVGDTDRDTV